MGGTHPTGMHSCYLSFYFSDDTSQQLTEEKIMELSKRFHSLYDLQDLAIKGLNIKSYIVDRHISKHQNNISSAAFSSIREWRNAQLNAGVAHTEMSQALEKINKTFYKQVL